MELGLSLGDATPSKPSDGVDKSLGFCMALGMKINTQDDDDDADEYDDVDDDDDYDNINDENVGFQDVTVSSQRLSPLTNPPVQLDLLPPAPVLPLLTSFPWSSEGGSSSLRLEFMGDGGRTHKRASSRASDEDDHHHGFLSRKKLRLSKEQSAYLEESFKEHNTLNPKQKLALAEQLHLRPRQVEVWFQNRRARTKLKQTEVDFEYLKRCCETLTDENRRLHKELQELRALKTSSNPFYKQLIPATTLTMCPSCERVATASATIPPPSTTKPVEQNSKKATTLSPKSITLMFPVSQAPPSSNSHHHPAAPS